MGFSFQQEGFRLNSGKFPDCKGFELLEHRNNRTNNNLPRGFMFFFAQILGHVQVAEK